MLSKYVIISIAIIVVLMVLRITSHVFGDKEIKEDMVRRIEKVMFAVYLTFAMLSCVLFVTVVITVNSFSIAEMIGLMVSSSGIIFTAMKNVKSIVDDKKSGKDD